MAPLVGVIMGSDSDLPVMKAACEMLEKFKIEYECTIVSAHRTPDRLVEYARSARRRGLKVIVAGAGGAAHLPGMVAAMTPLPVVGHYYFQASASGAPRVIYESIRRAVRAHDRALVLDLKFLEHLAGGLHDRQVAVAAHDHAHERRHG